MSSYRQCGPWGLVMNQVMENTAMTQEAIYMPQAWSYAQQACLRCKDVNAPWRRTTELTTYSATGTQGPYNERCITPGAGSAFPIGSQRGGGSGLTYLSQYALPYSFGTSSKPPISGADGAYYGVLPPW